MRNWRLAAVFGAVLGAGLLVGCRSAGTAPESRVSLPIAANIHQAIAVLHPTQGNHVTGTVRFRDVPGGVRVSADISGLSPNSEHGFHIHEYGDCSDPKAESAGGHYDPMHSMTHGMPGEDRRHRHGGDMGNIQADGSGNAHLELTIEDVTIAGDNPILGRAVIVHAKRDDGSQPAGNAGTRVACGVIGVARPR